MALHFSPSEFDARLGKTITMMQARGLDGMLLFRQESMYYLTGYDTFGYVFFQCLYLGCDGRLMLLTRAPDLRQAAHTSIIKDIRVWVDGPSVDPAIELRENLRSFNLAGMKLGVEWDSYGLTAKQGKQLSAAFDGFAELKDASDLVSRLRVVKSPTEIGYVREAARLGDLALDAAHSLTGPGVDEGEILAAMHGVIYASGGDDPANEFIIGSGKDALLCRYKSVRRRLSDNDQLTLEFAGAWRHYHAALMRTLLIGKVPEAQKEMHKVACDAQRACESALIPGNPLGDVFAAHVKVLDKAGYQAHRLNATGYSLGSTFAPNWMDWPMCYAGNPTLIEEGMVFFLHMIIFDSDKGLAMTTGRTSLVNKKGAEVLSRHELLLFVR